MVERGWLKLVQVEGTWKYRRSTRKVECDKRGEEAIANSLIYACYLSATTAGLISLSDVVRREFVASSPLCSCWTCTKSGEWLIWLLKYEGQEGLGAIQRAFVPQIPHATEIIEIISRAYSLANDKAALMQR